ncbi:cell adhesion molecule CEACAM21-like [Mustelus asterias]
MWPESNMAKCSPRHSAPIVKGTSFVPVFRLFTVCGALTLATPSTTTQATVGEHVLFHVNIRDGASYDLSFRSKSPSAIIALWAINNTVELKSIHSLYKGRAQWNMSGSVMLHNVQINDSRGYETEINYYGTELESSDIESFELSVFEPVSQPDVKIIGNCTTPNTTLNCSVSNGTNVTFHWRKETLSGIIGSAFNGTNVTFHWRKETLSGIIGSAFNGTQLVIDLHNEEKQHVYRCMVENPVSRAESEPVRLELCVGNNGSLFWAFLLSLIPMSFYFYYAIISTKAGRATQEHGEQPIALPNGLIEPTYTTLLYPRGTV